MMKNKGVFLAAILTAVLCISGNLLAATYGGGTGEPNNPYQIADTNDLLALAADTNDYDKCFILTADIDMTGEIFAGAVIAVDTDNIGWNEFQGTEFTGVFDGAGKKISNLVITGQGDVGLLGLFGQIGIGGQVKNLRLVNVEISGSDFIGGLVGINKGSITSCYTTGSVNGTGWYVGGLVGFSTSPGSITYCFSKASVSGAGYYVGGLVGQGGSINSCYAMGPVSGTGRYIGGLAGLGGDSIMFCYSTGLVSGTNYSGGLIGDTESASITSCFWDKETSNQLTSAGGTGKTTAEMKTLLTFTDAGWDFINVWAIGQNQTYPYLRTRPSADLNYDGMVNLVDFAIFAGQWLEGI